MMSSDYPPAPILTLTPELKEKLKTRNQNSLAQLLKKNSGSVFFRESALLAPLREAGNVSVVRQVPVSSNGSGLLRRRLDIALKDDAELMSKKAPGSVMPFACWFIRGQENSIFIKMFFAVMDPTLQMFRAIFITLLADAVRILEIHWEVIIDATETGIVPDVCDFGNARPYLEMYVKPNPGRAAELRTIEKGKEGWLSEVWPELAVVVAVASGIYAASVPKVRHHFGSKVVLINKYYVATECSVAWGYTSSDLNLFKIDNFEHIEFIDIEARDKAEILQAWELESGKKYEVVVTTHDGLWRYQLKDIIEAGGFDPIDGQPLVRFSERSSVGFRVSSEFVPERTLQDAVSSLANTLGYVSEFTIVVDNRKAARAYGFFVELDGELGAHAHEAPKALKEYLFSDLGYKQYSADGRIGDPTIRIVAPGTFQNYRGWRMATTGTAAGQIKVPITTMDDTTNEWLSQHVVLEVGV